VSLAGGGGAGGFEPPVYPYERLAEARAAADALPGGVVDLSIGTPYDPPPAAVVEALSTSNAERGYPMSVGSARLREAAAGWMDRRLGVSVDSGDVYACVGTKEFVATAPQWLRLRRPDRDTVLYPAISYPTYEMGATLAGCRAVPVPLDENWRLDLSAISADDAARALVLWVNTPGNPAGQVDDLGAAAAWGRSHDVPVFSDECYIEFTWTGERRTILAHGTEGVVALHSISKRSNLAGLRAGFYAGDPELVHYLGEVRKHVGMLVPGPVQAAAAVSLDDDAHVDEQRERYWARLERFREILAKLDVFPPLPAGGFYLWAAVDDAWAFTDRLARQGGALVSPGEFYGPTGAGHVRVALVQPLERLELVAERLGLG
jgi:succinyldiaminopimelate transaminase